MLLVRRIFLNKHLPAGPGGEEEWSGMALSSPAGATHPAGATQGPTQPSPLASHPARVPHIPAQLRRDAQQGQTSLRAQLTWHGSSTHGHAAGPPGPCQAPRPAAPGQAALALHGPGHPPPETHGGWARGSRGLSGGCGDGCGAAQPCPALPAPAWSGPAEPAVPVLTQLPPRLSREILREQGWCSQSTTSRETEARAEKEISKAQQREREEQSDSSLTHTSHQPRCLQSLFM